VKSLWQKEIDTLINMLIEEGKKLGYIKNELSQQAIRYCFNIIRNGAFSNTRMLDEMKIDANLAHDLNHLFIFGLVAKRE
jgi:hypothetical protein